MTYTYDEVACTDVGKGMSLRRSLMALVLLQSVLIMIVDWFRATIGLDLRKYISLTIDLILIWDAKM
jgi:hypothetical protein